MKFTPLLLLLIGAAVLTGGDIVLRFWVGNNKFSYYSVGLFLYLIAMIFLSQTYKFTNIALASAIFIILNLIILIIISTLYFHDKVTIWQGFGFILALIAIFLMNIGK
jgi:multidrug transporter EmrE-like cation transporter